MSATDASDCDEEVNYSCEESGDDNDNDSDWTLSDSEDQRIATKNVRSGASSIYGDILEFTGSNCIKGDAKKAISELDFFYCVFPQELLKLIADETTKCMRKSVDCGVNVTVSGGFLQEKKHSRRLRDITTDDICRFIAVTLAMGLVRKENMADYWTTDTLLATPFFGKCMPQEQFFTVLSFLAFEDCDKTFHNDDPNYDLFEIRKFFNILNNKFKEVYSPTEEMVVDRVIITDKGLRHFVLKDRGIVNLKLYRMLDKNGYLFHSDFLMGKELQYADLSFKVSAHHSISHLVQCVSKRGHKLFISDVLTSADLFQDLYYVHQINCNDFMDSKQKGDLKARFNLGKWGRRHLYLNNTDNLIKNNSKGILNSDPTIKMEYDSLFNHNLLVGAKKLFFHLLDFATSNAHVLFKMAKKDVPLKDFRMKLISQLIESSIMIPDRFDPEFRVFVTDLDILTNKVMSCNTVPKTETIVNDNVPKKNMVTVHQSESLNSHGNGVNKICGDAEKAHSEMDFFFCVFLPEFVQLMTDKTNKFMHATLSCKENIIQDEVSKPSLKRRRSFKDISSADVTRFIALSLAMNHVRKENLTDYWSTEPLLATPIFGKCMPSHKYFSILRFLCFEDCPKISNDTDLNCDSSWKIRKFLVLLKRRFKEVYYPTEELIVDKVVFAINGLRHFLPIDRDHVNLKMYRLVDKNGYLFNFDFHLGKQKMNDDFIESESLAVKQLVQCVSGKGHELFVNDILSSPNLLQDLKDIYKINSHELICYNQKKVLKEKLKSRKECIRPLCFNNTVNLMETVSSDGILNDKQESATKNNCFYNTYESKLFYLFLDIAATNAHVLFKTSKTNVSLKDFRMKLVSQLLDTVGMDISEDEESFIGSQCAMAKPPKETHVEAKTVQTHHKEIQVELEETEAKLKESLIKRKGNRGYHRGYQAKHKGCQTNLKVKFREKAAIPKPLPCPNNGHWPIGKKVQNWCVYCISEGYTVKTYVSCSACDTALCVNCFEPYHRIKFI